MDSAACSMIDSHHGYDVVKIERMQRYGPDRGKKIKYDAPKCNETYNKVMGQVDRLDQLRASKKGFGTLELTRKRHKWTDKFADVLKDLGNTVALTLYNEAGDGVETPVSHPEFIIQVHEDWLNAESWYSAASGGRRRSAAPAPVPNTSPTRPKRPPSNAPGQHITCSQIYPRKTTKADGSATIHNDVGPCIACKLQDNVKRQTTWGCKDCDPPCYLHPGKCFERYHRKLADGSWTRPATRRKRKGTEKDQLVNRKKPTARGGGKALSCFAVFP